MEAWEKHYLHEKAKRDAYYKTMGWEIPKNEKYGTLTTYEIRIWSSDFWKHFIGHDSLDFRRCCCNKP